MSSRSAIRDLDAAMIEAFADDGLLADRGTYIDDSLVSAVDVTVMIDRAVQRFGEYGQIVGTENQIGLQLSQVIPKAGGVVTIGAGTADEETFTLGRKQESSDVSTEWWSVTS